jgi:hypothetical protein
VKPTILVGDAGIVLDVIVESKICKVDAGVQKAGRKR